MRVNKTLAKLFTKVKSKAEVEEIQALQVSQENGKAGVKIISDTFPDSIGTLLGRIIPPEGMSAFNRTVKGADEVTLTSLEHNARAIFTFIDTLARNISSVLDTKQLNLIKEELKASKNNAKTINLTTTDRYDLNLLLELKNGEIALSESLVEHFDKEKKLPDYNRKNALIEMYRLLSDCLFYDPKLMFRKKS